MYSRGHCILLLVKNFKALNSGLLQGIFVRKIRKDWIGWFYSTSICTLCTTLESCVAIHLDMLCAVLHDTESWISWAVTCPACREVELKQDAKSPFPVHSLVLVNNNPFLQPWSYMAESSVSWKLPHLALKHLCLCCSPSNILSFSYQWDSVQRLSPLNRLF